MFFFFLSRCTLHTGTYVVHCVVKNTLVLKEETAHCHINKGINVANVGRCWGMKVHNYNDQKIGAGVELKHNEYGLLITLSVRWWWW